LLLAFSFIGQAQQERVIKSLNLQDADVNAVLRFLSEFSGRNIAASKEVKGTVDVQLRDVTWRQALEVILKTNHLVALEEEEGYIRVLPIEELHKEKLSAHQFEQDKQDLEPLEHRILPVEHATAEEVKYALGSVLSKRGRVEIDARTNSLVVTDIPENLDLIARLVEDLDKKTPQITISAELYEVDTRALLELGIDWTVIQNEEPGQVYPETDYERRGEQTTTTGLSEAIGRFTYSTVEDNVQLDAVLSAMVSDNKAEILAHPEITTLDNKEATILMGQEVPLKVLDEAGNVITQLTQVGTQLTVTPHVTADSTILLELKPERSSYEVDPGAGIIINTQRAYTNVVVNDGQTAVIGGLTTEDIKKSEKGLPILKDIPLLGRLFKFTRDEVVKSELVILVTPRIVISRE
jgi:type IV pilus secretin PilQ/predicted competence protein